MIVIIYKEETGAGKTALNAKLAGDNMTVHAHSHIRACRAKVELLNRDSSRRQLTVPDKHITFCNFTVETEPVIMRPRKNLIVDPAKIGLYNPNFETTFFPPFSKFHITEAQRVWPSRNTNERIDPAVFGWFESTRHAGHDIYMDCQRHTGIDLAIRGIANEFIKPLLFRHKTDGKFGWVRHDVYYANPERYGNITLSEWQCLVLFNTHDVDRHLETGKVPKNSEMRTYTNEGNIFNTYDSTGCDAYHYAGREYQDFDLREMPDVNYTVKGINAFNAEYGPKFALRKENRKGAKRK